MLKRVAMAWLLLGLLPTLGICQDPTDQFVGVWRLWSVNGLPLSETKLEVFELSPDSLPQAGLPEDGVRIETSVLSDTLTIFPDGEYLGERVVQRSYVISASDFRALGGVPQGNESVRETQPADTVRTLGPWRIVGDSIELLIDRAAAVEALVQELRDMYPSTPESELRSWVETSLRDIDLPPRLVAARLGDRLVGRDNEGNLVAYRRPQP